ncbi:GNAT family N-acetyltransferase [Streptomyces sp. 4R-3d]|uniref:GNAT family N-acetyltransferase n=2 Tax=Streptomyces TaxID=1883 RepID=UPI00107169FA|nr:GNAT family N-acetyltransferase [Streptomyces sp. 4R-3d]TFI21529.1 GNAT family N-acetyltransferase [Streptomyces sp. 4R-3d]
MRHERISVRPREAADLDECVRVLAEVHDNDGYPVNWPQDPADWLAPAESPAAWVALLDDRIAGHVCLSHARPGDTAPEHWSSRTGLSPADTAVVSRLFVSPKARGQGIGALLLTELVRDARGRGLHPVLDVVTSDRRAAALYERQGWTLMATGEQRWGPDETVRVHCYAAPVAPAP